MRMSDAILSAEIEIEVPFNDLDPMGVVWHGNYLAYLERARSALLTKLGYDYEEMVESGFAWPIPAASANASRSASQSATTSCARWARRDSLAASSTI